MGRDLVADLQDQITLQVLAVRPLAKLHIPWRCLPGDVWDKTECRGFSLKISIWFMAVGM